MVTEEERYKADTFRIIGIGMLTPLGPVFLTPSLLLKQLGVMGLAVYACVSFVSFLVGGIILEAGRRFIDKKGTKRRWNPDQLAS